MHKKQGVIQSINRKIRTMINLTEQEFIDMVSEETYVRIVQEEFNLMKQQDAFKRNDPMAYQVSLRDVKLDGEEHTLVLESTAKILGAGAVDFGIVGISISDKKMPDEVLDKYNKMKKIDDRVKFFKDIDKKKLLDKDFIMIPLGREKPN